MSFKEIKELVGHITKDIDILRSYSYKQEAQFEPYGTFEHNTFYNDKVFSISYYSIFEGETEYSQGTFIGISYTVYLKNGSDKVIVLDVEIDDKNISIPKAQLKTYRTGSWEQHLHLLASKYKEKLDVIEEREAYYKNKEEKEKERLEQEKEYQKTLNFSPINDKEFFK